MSKFYKLFSVLLILVPCLMMAQGSGSKGLRYVQSASTLNPQRLDVNTNLKIYTKVGDFLGESKPTNFETVNYWDVQGIANISYGLADHFDASFTAQVYQDVHNRQNEFNAPGDLFLDLKAGSFGFSNNKFNLGGLLSFRFPTGETHNYPFEAYSGGAFEYGAHFLFSFYNDPFLTDRDISFHANLGFHAHNDAGQVLFSRTDVNEVTGDPVIVEFKAGEHGNANANALRYGLGFTYPAELFDLNLEVWGNSFIDKPDSAAFSRENYVYVTPSVVFKPRWWVRFVFGLDLRLSSDTDETLPAISFVGQNLDLPNYSSWKLTTGLNFTLNPGRDRIKGGVGGQTDIRKKVDFYERLLQEREKTRSIEEELRRLKREREQAEKELEELRQLLEEEG